MEEVNRCGSGRVHMKGMCDTELEGVAEKPSNGLLKKLNKLHMDGWGVRGDEKQQYMWIMRI